MTQPEISTTLDPIAPADPATAPGPPRGSLPSARDTPAKCTGSSFAQPPGYFEEALEDAERLLKYAAEIGFEIEDDIRDHILQARIASNTGWNEETAANLLAALAKLAARMKPVTAESLKAWHSDTTRATVRNYWIVAICLAAVIVPFSGISFVASALSATIRTDIATGNDLAVKLRAKLGAPLPNGADKNPDDPDGVVIAQLQQYAATVRAIDGRTRQLSLLVCNIEQDPNKSIRKNLKGLHDTFQLPAGLPDWAKAASDLTDPLYQNVRYWAQSVVDDVSVFYGAIAVCLLPVLYALLGTCAYLLRTFEQQMAARTFAPCIGNSARFLIAAIGGAVVGLFNNFIIGQGASIPPLAIAFLLGYAVDVFFAFLEGMLQPFIKSSASSPSLSPPSGWA